MSALQSAMVGGNAFFISSYLNQATLLVWLFNRGAVYMLEIGEQIGYK